MITSTNNVFPKHMVGLLVLGLFKICDITAALH